MDVRLEELAGIKRNKIAQCTVDGQTVLAQIEIASVLITAVAVTRSIKDSWEGHVYRLGPSEPQIVKRRLSVRNTQEEVLIPFRGVTTLDSAILNGDYR